MFIYMTFHITLNPSQQHFTCEEEDTLLNAAHQAGIQLPYSCKNGACGSCKGKILSGQVSHKPHQAQALSNEEEKAGWALLCCAQPQSDIIIEAKEILSLHDFPTKKMPVRVAQLNKLSSDVMHISLQQPGSESLAYRAGQYIDFILQDGKRRSYSLAAPAHQDKYLNLHIRHMPGGLFTDHVFQTLKERDILRIEGPQGTFFLREDTNKPIIFLASGTGFAPIKAMIEQMQLDHIQRPVTLYWGGRRPHDLYMHNLCQTWVDTLPDFTYIPVISDALPQDNWSGRTGLVHRAVMKDISNLSNYQIYACGVPVMVNAARHDFVTQRHLPNEEFYADAFTSEADLAHN
jgi:CDP-4-dehydro-6-deoxyglucose reductase